MLRASSSVDFKVSGAGSFCFSGSVLEAVDHTWKNLRGQGRQTWLDQDVSGSGGFNRSDVGWE